MCRGNHEIRLPQSQYPKFCYQRFGVLVYRRFERRRFDLSMFLSVDVLSCWRFSLRTDWRKLHDMFKARDAKTWQSEIPILFSVTVCALNLLFINIFTMLLVQKADAWLKQNMSCGFVNSFDFALEKQQSRWSARAFLPSQNRTN